MIASALAVSGVVAVLLVSAEPAFAGDQLTITSGGGAYQKAEHMAIFEPFSKATGIKITEAEYDYGIAKIKAMVETNSVSWDVVDVSSSEALRLCDEGILETIDWKKLGLDRGKFFASDKFDCGVPNAISATVIAYDKDRLPNGPKTIADLFDLQKFPGKRGLIKGSYANLEWALIADGVAVKDAEKVLATPGGVDRAFKKLDTIKKNVVWWTSGQQPVQLLADGEVIMTAAYNGRIYDAVKNSGKHFEIMWDAAVLNFNLWTIPKGTPRRDDGYKFIAFAASPQSQAELTRYIPYGPSNNDALGLVDPAMLSNLPTAPDKVAVAVERDAEFGNEKGDELSQRFSAWLAN